MRGLLYIEYGWRDFEDNLNGSVNAWFWKGWINSFSTDVLCFVRSHDDFISTINWIEKLEISSIDLNVDKLWSELKTEEGYSAEIVRTYIPGDICPHNISRKIYVSRGRCCADIVRTYISRDICRTISFFGFHLCLPIKGTATCEIFNSLLLNHVPIGHTIRTS